MIRGLNTGDLTEENGKKGAWKIGPDGLLTLLINSIFNFYRFCLYSSCRGTLIGHPSKKGFFPRLY